jgi:hypothetical protein
MDLLTLCHRHDTLGAAWESIVVPGQNDWVGDRTSKQLLADGVNAQG